MQIRMDALGVLDVSAETVALDATLYDSRILQFTLTGEWRFARAGGVSHNLSWRSAGSIRGLPRHRGFPCYNDWRCSLADGDTLQLRCQAYLAVTSNTVQFGARVDSACGRRRVQLRRAARPLMR